MVVARRVEGRLLISVVGLNSGVVPEAKNANEVVLENDVFRDLEVLIIVFDDLIKHLHRKYKRKEEHTYLKRTICYSVMATFLRKFSIISLSCSFSW